MTSANVSDVPILLNFGQTQVQSAAKSDNTSSYFQDLMIQNVSLPGAQMGTSNLTNPETITTADSNAASYNVARKIPQETSQNVLHDKDVTNEKQAILEFASKTNEVLEEELDVTEEEIVAAMESLGLTYMDLLNPSNLTKLISELSTEDSISLLVTDTVSNILDSVSALGVDLLSSADMNIDELKEVEILVAGLEPVKEEVPEEFQNILDTVADTVQTNPTNETVITTTPEETTPEDEAFTIVIDEETKREPNLGSSETKLSVDETNDLAEEVEAGIETLTKETGSTTKDDTKGDDFLGKSNTPKPTVAENNVRNTESAVGPTFQNTVTEVTAEGEVVTTTYTSGVDTRDIIQQIVMNAKTTISEQVTRMEMELNPQNLGRMILNVAENDGKITAHITLQNEAVRQAMETQMSVLKDNLNQQGIKVEAVEVSVGTHEFERNLEEGQQMQQEQGERNEQTARQNRRTNINLNNLDELQGLMSEEEALVASMMRDAGNSINFTA